MISLAREIGAPADVVRDYGMAGLLHDIGKIAVSDEILSKAEALTAAEMQEMRRHPEIGHQMLVESEGVPTAVLDVCLHHHERPDGTGYPFGLKGDAISRAVRIASICDVYDAMTSSRPYKSGMTPLAAITALDAAEGQFDRDLLFRFMRNIDIYPAGKLVRLRGNRLAVTLPTRESGFGPVFRVFYSTTTASFIPYENVILSDRQSDDEAVSAEDPAAWFSADWPAMAIEIAEGRNVRPEMQ
jgi:HD-GYP domain-containing protein (c-di-GMP phosphodiesterase class II)